MRLLIALCAVLGVSSSAAAQPPPIQGVTGTIATDGTIRSEHKAAQKVVEGVKKILPGGNGTSENPLDALIEGSHVVVRDVADSGDALKAMTQGVVIEVN